jgi:hypothetical protein
MTTAKVMDLMACGLFLQVDFAAFMLDSKAPERHLANVNWRTVLNRTLRSGELFEKLLTLSDTPQGSVSSLMSSPLV